MPRFGPISRRELIAGLIRLGFDGPNAGGRHEVMERGATKVILPNPHRGDISRDLLARILRDAGIGRVDWESL